MLTRNICLGTKNTINQAHGFVKYLAFVMSQNWFRPPPISFYLSVPSLFEYTELCNQNCCPLHALLVFLLLNVDCLLKLSSVYLLVSSNLNLLIVFNSIHTTIVIACLKILLSQNGDINLQINSHILAKNKVYNWLFKINKQLL